MGVWKDTINGILNTRTASPFQSLWALLNPRTDAESAAGVTPVNYQYLAGVPDRYQTNTTPGTTDMTTGIIAAFNQMKQSGGAALQFLASTYLHSGSVSPMLIDYTHQNAVIQGVRNRTVLINNGVTDVCSSIKIFGGSFFFIDGIIFSGRSGHANRGIELVDDGTYRCGFGRISNCVGFTNNVFTGFIDIVNANSVWLENIDYWPTSISQAMDNGGATVDNNGQFSAIYLHALAGHMGGSLAGNTNDIHIRNMNCSGVNPSVAFTGSVGGATTGTLTASYPYGNGVFPFMFDNGEQRTVTITTLTTCTWSGALAAGTVLKAPNGSAILVDGSTEKPPAFGTITISDALAERTGTRSLWLRQVWNASVKDCFFENADVSVDSGCNHVTFDTVDMASLGDLTVDGTQPTTATQVGTANIRINMLDVVCHLYTIDAANAYVNERNITTTSTYTQNALYLTRVNATPASTNGVVDAMGGWGMSFGKNTAGNQTVSNGTTMAGSVLGGTVWTVNPSGGAATGVILTAGVRAGQMVVIININASNSITMAASGTSRVADGVGCVIAALTQKTFFWDDGTALWYHS